MSAKVLKIILAVIVIVSLVLDVLVRDVSYAKFWWEKIYGFDLVFGFVSFILIIYVSKLLGKILHRDEDYYDK
ncbi:hypothetical protein M1N67_01125 [Peptococcaceae bacterium]|nr:hypothetical protein [Peptococcaceae bacterium]MCL0067533.1 hypothetical protein [Peptococcaceae bacterium]